MREKTGICKDFDIKFVWPILFLFPIYVTLESQPNFSGYEESWRSRHILLEREHPEYVSIDQASEVWRQRKSLKVLYSKSLKNGTQVQTRFFPDRFSQY